MKSPTPLHLSLSLVLLTWIAAPAQTAADFFHDGAMSYLSNNIPAALQVVTNGLQRFPTDEKLQRLYELLNQQQDQQQQQQDQEQPNEDQKQEQSQPDEQEKSEQNQDESQQQQENKPNDQTDGDNQSKPQPDDPREQGEPQQAAPQAMTPEEAQRLLDAQKGDEQVLIFQPQTDPRHRPRVLKDW